MKEQTGEHYRFCPKCGALMENGICPECAKKVSESGVYSSGAHSESTHSKDMRSEDMHSEGVKEKRQEDNRIWVAAAAAAAVLLLIAAMASSFFSGYFLVKFSKYSAKIFSEELDREAELSKQYADDDWNGEEADAYAYEPEEEYVPSPEDEYYYGPCDSINENVPYSFIHKTYSNEDAENNIDIVINYLELKGEEIPNLEELNQELEAQALYYAEDFAKDTYYAEYGNSFSAYISSYVTYNDEDTVSIVLDEYVAIDEMYHVDLYAVNIDLKNGVILDNESLLQIDEAFAEEFRRRNNEQNGNIAYLDALSDEEVARQLQNKAQVIAYYTPLGMEVGLNYSMDSVGGWFTVTYKDYQNYLKKF